MRELNRECEGSADRPHAAVHYGPWYPSAQTECPVCELNTRIAAAEKKISDILAMIRSIETALPVDPDC